jgi:hypothetical protein
LNTVLPANAPKEKNQQKKGKVKVKTKKTKAPSTRVPKPLGFGRINLWYLPPPKKKQRMMMGEQKDR